MAFNKNNTVNNSKTFDDLPKVSLKGASVSGCRMLSDKVIAFTLNLPGLSIYNMKVIDGKNGAFVSVPQQKSKNGDKWNDVVSVWLSDADEANLAETVINATPAQGAAVDWKTRHEVK